MCKTYIRQFESSFQLRFLGIGGGIISVHHNISSHSAHRQIFHVYFTVFDSKLTVHIVEGHLVKQYLFQISVHLEVDVAGNFNNSRGTNGIRSCYITGRRHFFTRSRHEIVQIEIVGTDIQTSFQGSAFQRITDIVFEPAVGSNVILTDVDGCFAQLKIFGCKRKE